MRKHLPLLWLVLSVCCSVIVAGLAQELYALVNAVLPMVILSRPFSSLVAVGYVSAVVVFAYLAGVFTIMVFVTRTEEKETSNG